MKKKLLLTFLAFFCKNYNHFSLAWNVSDGPGGKRWSTIFYLQLALFEIIGVKIAEAESFLLRIKTPMVMLHI